MEGGALFNPGFLGGSFLWWIGQVADDSTWRDNISSGKISDKNSVPGWGYRYKVRIIGLHDQEEETIPSDQLPWSQVMYPITAGSGGGSSGQTPNIRQGMFVFGFFLDGQDQQVPVIMGVLGNNGQTALESNTALTGGKNYAGQSGHANTKEPKGRAKPTVPATDVGIVKPKTPEQAKECAPAPAGVKANKFGLRPDLPLTTQQLGDAKVARQKAEDLKLTGQDKEDYVMKYVSGQMQSRCREANSSTSPSQPGATLENTDVHVTNAANKILEDKYQEKTPLMKPDDKVGSAIKCIQTTIENLTKQIAKYLNAIKCYADAASLIIGKIKNLIANAACIIARYMKVVFDKIMEYVLKKLNNVLTKVVSSLPSSFRSLFGDIKETLTELILCLYNKITQGLCGVIQGALDQAIKPDQLEQQARESASDQRKVATVPVCYAEELVGQVIALNKDQINDANNSLVNNLNAFLEDVQGQIAGVSGALPDVAGLIGDISGSITSALSFANIKLNIFGCELAPNVSVSDFYNLARGGASQPDSQLPSNKSVDDVAASPAPNIKTTPEVPYAEPTSNTSNLKVGQSNAETKKLAAQESALNIF